jgi:hypothetical protein
MSVARAVGLFFVAISTLSIVQTVREGALWKSGEDNFAEESLRGVPIHFGDHLVTITDDQPNDSEHSYKESEGSVQLLIDSRPYRTPSRARIRRGLNDFGRYFGWIDAWVFTSGRDTTFWLACRIQPSGSASPTFEITTARRGGAITTEVFEPWQLSTDYRRFRATNFMQTGARVFPLSKVDMLGMMPIFALVFPIGTFLLGILLMRRGNGMPKPGDSSPPDTASIRQ